MRSLANKHGGYDAFISYSRKVDRELAVALEKNLKVFAKPVFKMRALNVFRDDASLTATPSLWGSIESALSRSRYMVLLASPESATSDWVKKELDWWLQYRSHDSLIFVLTDGTIEWNSPTTTSFPVDYFAKFPEEPRWVDLRWARTSAGLSQRNPAFNGALAEVAGWIRGQPKDALIGEDVTQHQRQIRYVRAGVIILVILLIAILAAAFIAHQQSEEAIRASIAARAAEGQAQAERRAAEAARDQESRARSQAQAAELEAIEERNAAVTARELEVAARRRADDERAKAERERAQAFQNLALAVETATSLADSTHELLASERSIPRQVRLKALEASENALWKLANQSDLQQVRRTVFITSLQNFSASYFNLGAQHESLRAWERVVELHRKLVDQQPYYLPLQSALGAALVRLANHRLGVGDRQGQIRDLSEAVEIYRRLQVAPFLPDPLEMVSISEPAFRKMVAGNLSLSEAELRRAQAQQ